MAVGMHDFSVLLNVSSQGSLKLSLVTFSLREKVTKGGLVAVEAQAADLTHAGGGGDALVAELLPLVDVGDVDLHAGHRDGLEGVQNGHGVVGVGPGIHNDGVVDPVGGLDSIHDGSLMVGLEAVHRGAVGGGKFF